MFDVGFSELLVIAVVALLVLGPERLPKAARFAGLWVRRARAQWHSVKAELERDLAAEDLRRSLQDTGAAMREAQAALRNAGGDAQRELDTVRGQLMQGTSPPPAATPDATTTDDTNAGTDGDDRAR
jgi:sec-independent protein translocase protein TatB